MDEKRPIRRDILLGFLIVFSLCSVCLNVILALHITHPTYWQDLQRNRLRPTAIGSSDHVRGSANSPVTVIEYADFQCPYCRQLHVTLQAAASEGKIRWVYRDYPLSMHEFAFREAEAAQCAGAQGKYWEYADALYAHQADITSSKAIDQELNSLSQEVHADPAAVMQCINSAQYRGVVQDEANEADKLQIEATPTIFINNKRHEGSVSYSELMNLITKH
jgi:protein-disulfide isomerase